MTTWLDLQSAVTVRRALGTAVHGGEQSVRRYDVWLALVDLHLEELRRARCALVWNWRRGYHDGWSPRTAAFAAWATNIQPGDAGAGR